ncbi:MAG TPA: ABC-F family ATP-binding cassette domain-containing protein [Acidimicrobiales bacterium]|nr:ABC-F family ATP-binding cassette domain-containing protein [Acidimicrobiales bacterium]
MPALPSALATLMAVNLSHDRGGRTVLCDISLTVGPSDRIGIVGPNGVGKSTLLTLLAGTEAPMAGSIRVDPPSASVGYLTQEHEAPAGETVRAALTRRTGVAAAEAELAAAASGLADGTRAADQRYEVALERYTTLSAGDLDARIDAVLAELGLTEPGLTEPGLTEAGLTEAGLTEAGFTEAGLGTGMADRPVATLSGGQESRLALAAIMLSRFDITLLDEPTNDLDFDGLERLESYVVSHAGAMVIVSHDRAFLDRTVTSVLELDEHDHTGRLYGGGWAGYLTERETARRHQLEDFALYQSRRSQLSDRARRERQWATSGVQREKRNPRDNDKAQRDFRINRTEQLASRARRTERALDALDVVDKPWEGWDLRFTIEQAPRAGAVVGRLAGAVIDRGTFTLGPVDLEIGWAERVALVGPNGSGKSTLVEALLGRLPLREGTQWLGPSVVVGELGQDRRALFGAVSVVDSVVARCGLTISEARSLLAKFGLGADHVTRPGISLSPGERTRAELATFQALGVNFLVLDEPSNHLDLPAIEQLEAALSGFTGTLLLVSHDRRLLEAVELTRRVELG